MGQVRYPLLVQGPHPEAGSWGLYLHDPEHARKTTIDLLKGSERESMAGDVKNAAHLHIVAYHIAETTGDPDLLRLFRKG